MTDTSKKTIVLFSGDLDKVLAAFVIANGAAAMGDDVTIFFTFWGLNVLRKSDKVTVGGKGALQKAFAGMMPRGAERLSLSHMNFGGMGRRLMKKMMRDHNVSSISEFIAMAQEQNIKFIACTMSMDVMGITRDELIDGLEFAGVATYLGEADEANVNLFI